MWLSGARPVSKSASAKHCTGSPASGRQRNHVGLSVGNLPLMLRRGKIADRLFVPFPLFQGILRAENRASMNNLGRIPLDLGANCIEVSTGKSKSAETQHV